MISPVKFIFALLLASLTVQAASEDPGKAAVDFLEKVRQGKLNLEPGGDTALSPQVSASKKQQIARRYERMARDLGTDPLEIGEIKQDEDFAAVIVRQLGDFDPSKLQIFPVALVKRGDKWAAAPVPASFENIGRIPPKDLRERLDLLERWMLLQQVADLENLREQAASLARKKIESRITVEELQNLTAQQALAKFLLACEQRDKPMILGLLGGLSKKLPDDWADRLKAAEKLSTTESRSLRMLTAPEVIRIQVGEEEEEDAILISIACLDPASAKSPSAAPSVELYHFDVVKNSEDLWQIHLPEILLSDSVGELDAGADDEEPDSALLEVFPQKFSAAHPPNPQESAALAQQVFLKTLEDGDLISLLRLTDLSHSPKASLDACSLAAQLWWSYHAPSSVHCAIPLAIKEEGNAALGIVQQFSTNNPDQLDARLLYYEKSANGWLWKAQPSPQLQTTFDAWAKEELKKKGEQWQETFLKESILAENIAALPSPTKEDAREKFGAWSEAIRHRNFEEILRHTARLKTPKSNSSLLKNLGYDIKSLQNGSQEIEITEIYQGKIWTAIGIKTGTKNQPSFPLYPMIQTPDGPRVLSEIDLFASSNRSRHFLNNTNLEKLAADTSQAAADELRALLAEHQKNIDAVKAGQ